MELLLISCLVNIGLAVAVYFLVKKNTYLTERKQYYKKQYLELKEQYFNSLSSEKSASIKELLSA